MLKKREFDLLVYLEAHPTRQAQRTVARNTGISVGSVNKLLGELAEEGLVKGGVITQKGLEALEPYRVKRAVFIAAGFGSRLVPITLNTPKPLVRVGGQRMIDTLMDAVLAQGITEIYVVRGYLAEQFDQLLYKYPMIKFIENPVYNEANNISSAYCARYLMKNAYVLEADLLVRNPAVITKYQYGSNYLAFPVEQTDDWCFYTDHSGRIVDMAVGGTNCHQMVGVSYWTEADGAKLAEDIQQVYQSPGGKERYWDQVALGYCRDNYQVYVRPCARGDIVEIDTFNELKQLDKTYCT